MLFLVAGKLEFLPPGKDAMHRSMASKELVTKDTRQRLKLLKLITKNIVVI